MSEQPKKLSFFGKVARWFRELKSEVKKIVWPTRSQVINNTLVVLAAVFLVGVMIWVVDVGFSALRELLISLA